MIVNFFIRSLVEFNQLPIPVDPLELQSRVGNERLRYTDTIS